MSDSVKYEPVGTVHDEDIQASEETDSLYSKLLSPSRTDRRTRTSPSSSKLILPILLLVLGLILASGIAGFLLGQYVERQATDSHWLEFPGEKKTVREYNHIFALPGGGGKEEEARQSWETLYPLGLGLVQHPDIAPNDSFLAVYHQLHCLDSIRHGYFAAMAGQEEADRLQPPKHFHHCFNYLRQALMCHADTNPEPFDPKLGEVEGGETPRTCRDFGRVTEWAIAWRTSNKKVAAMADLTSSS